MARHEVVDECVVAEFGWTASFYEGAIERRLGHMDVGVDESGSNHLSRGIDRGVDLARVALADEDDVRPSDDHVAVAQVAVSRAVECDDV